MIENKQSFSNSKRIMMKYVQIVLNPWTTDSARLRTAFGGGQMKKKTSVHSLVKEIQYFLKNTVFFFSYYTTVLQKFSFSFVQPLVQFSKFIIQQESGVF